MIYKNEGVNEQDVQHIQHRESAELYQSEDHNLKYWTPIVCGLVKQSKFF